MTAPRIHFEDFVVGEVAYYGSRLVTREEIVAFAADYDPQPFHLDDEAARESLLGGLAASGWHMCAVLMRLNCDGFLNDSTSMGAPGIDEVKWLRPLRPGTRVGVRRHVLEARGSRSRPEMGLVRFRFELMADDGEPVMSQVGTIMFGRRAA